MLDKFAEELKQAREQNDLTLQQLAAKTRIDIKFLEQMEFGDFSFLPEVYARAFIKDYSKVVGLDEVRMLKKYDLAKKGQLFAEETGQSEKEKAPGSNTETDAAVEEEPKQPAIKKMSPPVTQSYNSYAKDFPFLSKGKVNAAYIGIAAIAVFVIAIIVYSVFFKDSDEIIVPEKTYEEIIEDSNRYEEEPKAAIDSIANYSASDSLRLTIQTTDSSWVKIIKDEKTTEEFILYPNSKKTVTAKENFKITLGNSGAVNLYLNNRLLNFTGRRRTKMSFNVDASGLSLLKNSPSINN